MSEICTIIVRFIIITIIIVCTIIFLIKDGGRPV